jgi:hypothetical protein
MAQRHHDTGGDNLPAGAAPGLSRRHVVAGGVVGGLGLSAGAGTAQADAHMSGHLGVARPGSTAVEFRGRIEQSGDSGQRFAAYGYLTRVVGASEDALFGGTPFNESSALLTVTAAGDLEARVLDMSVHSLDIVGSMSVHQRRTGGADFADPGSFAQGRLVARFGLRLQDILAVFAAGSGIPTLTGDMRQTTARSLVGPLSGKVFGVSGARTRLFATGLGRLTDPVTLNALLEIAGNWSVE